MARAFSSGEKKLFVLSALLVVALVGGGWLWARAKRAPRFVIAPYPTAPKPNGYDLYLAAARAVVPAKPAVDSVTDGGLLTDPKARAKRYSLARRDAWLGKNRAAWTLFDRALRTPTLAPPARSQLAPMAPSYRLMRQLARDKMTQSNTAWLRGDAKGALQSGLDVVQMGHDTRRGCATLGNLVGIAIGAIGRRGASQTVEKLDAAQAKTAARRLEKMLARRWSLAQSLTEEKNSALTTWLGLFKNSSWRGFTIASRDGAPIWKKVVRGATISKQHVLDETAAIYDRNIALAAQSYQSQVAAQSAPPASMGLADESLMRRQFFNNARDLAGDQSLMLLLALRAYKLEHGAYPLALAALAPNYLSAIPADPFGGGEPWHYKTDGKSCAVWSIGPDGKDDGGAPIPWRHKRTTWPDERARLPFASPDSKGDYVAGKNG